MPALHLDLYVAGPNPWRGRTDDLLRSIEARQSHRPLVVEGVGLLDALNWVGRRPDLLLIDAALDDAV
jgi:hypothetical protein